jgi:UDP-GlcNAc:undecaprenyl-phosphate GlcNAc-1-phosphate transferase
MLWFVVACVGPSCLVSYLVTAGMSRWAPQWGLVDQPAAVKGHATHVRPTPLGGGLGIFAGFLVPMMLAQVLARWAVAQPEWFTWIPPEVGAHLPGVIHRSGPLLGVMAAGTLLVIMGLLDDFHALPWPPRLLVQVLTAAGVVAAGVRGTVFITHPWLVAMLTVVWIVFLTNSLNFLDNMDGLSGGIALIASGLFACVMLAMVPEPRWLVGGALLVLSGAVAGFLCHNWPPAAIFMGDSGSMFIGQMLASLTVLGTFYDPTMSSRHVILAPLCVLAVPLYDTTTVVFIRLWKGHSPFHPDKNHFSHRLVALGLSRRDAVLTIHLTTLTTGLAALLLYRLPDWLGAWLVLAIVFCTLFLVTILERAGRRRPET